MALEAAAQFNETHMSYLALARKWRPRTFSQLLGQDHVSKGLVNSLTQQRLHHAYLFTGTRGVGKTSVARLLAKALNCEQGITAEPCLTCDACQAIEQGRFIDLIEVDAASRTGVEDTRALLENIQYATVSGRFKIYLIDEVHMLSQHSFNALLKTLEEPPEHVKFLLATSEPQKLPVTVLSRCLQFNLRHLPSELISTHLADILKEEKISYEEQALSIIAQAAKGSMRDSLSILDQAIANCDGEIRAQELKHLLGYTQQDYALDLLKALAANDAGQLIELSRTIAAQGSYFNYVLDEIIHHLHQMAVYQSLGNQPHLMPFSTEIKDLATRFSEEDVQLFYQIALQGSEEIHLAPVLAIGFEMTLLRMLTFRPAARAKQPPLAYLDTEGIEEKQPQKPLSQPSLKAADKIDQPVVEISEKKDAAPDWSSILPLLKLRGLSLNAAENAELIDKEGGQISLRVSKGHLSLFTPNVVRRIEASLADYFQQKIKLNLCSEETIQASPAQQKQRASAENIQHAEQALGEDPVFQQVQEKFSAKIVKNSIAPLQDDL